MDNNSRDTIDSSSFMRQRSIRHIQTAISKMNPQVVKSVFASASPIHQNCIPSRVENTIGTAPLTIFYNGSVAVFDVPTYKAETILKKLLVEQGKLCKGTAESTATDNNNPPRSLFEILNNDLPIKRKMSVQRFLEKRKERLISVCPYDCNT